MNAAGLHSYIGRVQRHKNTGSVWSVASVTVRGQLGIVCERGGRDEVRGDCIDVWPSYFLNEVDWARMEREA